MDSDVNSDRPCRFGIRVGRFGGMTGLCGRDLEGRYPLRGCRSDVAGQGSRRSRSRSPPACPGARPLPCSTSATTCGAPPWSAARHEHILAIRRECRNGPGRPPPRPIPTCRSRRSWVRCEPTRRRRASSSPRARSSRPTPRRTTRWDRSILTRGQPDMALSQQRDREALAAARGPSPPAGADPAPIGAGGSAQGRHPDRRSTPGAGDGALRSFRTLPASLPVTRPTSRVRPNRNSSRRKLIETRSSGSTDRIHRLMRD